jgi:Sulfotransferase family
MRDDGGNHTATFVFSAGRCGTQWLAATLAEHYGDLAETVHEPIDHKYLPRTLLRSRRPLRDHPCGDDLRRHMLRIADVLRERDYIETGWPVFAAVPLLLHRFRKRVRIVHLVRHPVYSACSMVTHSYYQPRRDDGYTRHAILCPTDEGVRFKHYASRWDGMSAYEKSLFHWAEINAYGLELGASIASANPWFRVQMEQLVAPSSEWLRELLRFLGLPIRDGALAARQRPVDQHRTQTDLRLDWEEIHDHPVVLELASRLGYVVGDSSRARIEARYVTS